MKLYRIIILIVFSQIFIKVNAQSDLRPVGRYEVGDTTIEVYNGDDLISIQEFKTIHHTDLILYREYNRLTKKLRKEGVFKGGYSYGDWKFYGFTGRLKKKISYDNMVKTYVAGEEGEERKTEITAVNFDFEKYKQDSIFVYNYRQKKGGAAVAVKNVVVPGAPADQHVQVAAGTPPAKPVPAAAPVDSSKTLAAKKPEKKTEKKFGGLFRSKHKEDPKADDGQSLGENSKQPAKAEEVKKGEASLVDKEQKNTGSAASSKDKNKPAAKEAKVTAKAAAATPVKAKKEDTAPVAEKKPQPKKDGPAAVKEKPVPSKPKEKAPVPATAASSPSETKAEKPVVKEVKTEPKKDQPAAAAKDKPASSKPKENTSSSAPAVSKPAEAKTEKPIVKEVKTEPKKDQPAAAAKDKPAPSKPKENVPAPASVTSKPLEVKAEKPVVKEVKTEPKKDAPTELVKDKPAPSKPKGNASSSAPAASKPLETKTEKPVVTPVKITTDKNERSPVVNKDVKNTISVTTKTKDTDKALSRESTSFADEKVTAQPVDKKAGAIVKNPADTAKPKKDSLSLGKTIKADSLHPDKSLQLKENKNQAATSN